MRAHALIPRAKAASAKAEAAKAPAPARPEVRQILHAPRPTADEPDNAVEQEADRVADSLMSLPGPGSAAAPPPLQPARGPVPGWPVAEDRVGHVQAALAGGEPLPDAVRDRFEPALGLDLGEVRVHQGPAAALAADALRAEAFAAGPHVVFGRGRYAPGTRPGLHLLAHELAHVAQQGAAGAARVDRHNAADFRLPATQPEALRFATDAKAAIDAELTALGAAADLRQRNVPGLVAQLGLTVGPLTPRHDSPPGAAAIHFFPGTSTYGGSVTLPAAAQHHVGASRNTIWIRAREHADVDNPLPAAQIRERVVRGVTEVGHTHATRQTQSAITTFEEYRARFNALYPEAAFAALSDRYDAALDSRGPKSARARAVFTSILGRYPAFATIYDSNTGGIRESVDRYLGPEGLNLLNAAGLQRLRAVFFGVAKPVPAASYPAFRTSITTVARTLSRAERDEVDRANDWRLLIDDHLTDPAKRDEIRDIIRSAVPPAPPVAAPVGGPPPVVAPGGPVTPQDFVDSVTLSGPAAAVPAIDRTVSVPLTPRSVHPNPAVAISSQITVTPAVRVAGPNQSPASPWPDASPTGAAFTPTVATAGAGGLDAQLALVNGPVGLAPAAPIPLLRFAIDDRRQANMIAGWRPLVDFNNGAGQRRFVAGVSAPRYFGGSQRIDVRAAMPAAPGLNPGLALSIDAQIRRGGAGLAAAVRAPYAANAAESSVINLAVTPPAVMPVGGDAVEIVTRLLDAAGVVLSTRIVAMTIGAEATYSQADAEARWNEDEAHLHNAAAGGFLAHLAAGVGAAPGLAGLIRTPANPTGPVDIHAMVMRHDSADYVTRTNGMVPDPTRNAYLIAPPPYAPHPDLAHTRVLQTGAGGFRIPSHPAAWPTQFVLLNRTPDVTLITPRRSDAALERTAIHEAVHIMNRSASGSPLERYKTEFRAYWMDGRFGPPHSAIAVSPGHFDAVFNPNLPQPIGPKSPRANRIFRNVYDNTRLYGFCKPNYDANTDHFREEVDSMLVPDGINLDLSERVEALRARFAAPMGTFAIFLAEVEQFYGIGAPPPGGVLTPADRLQISRSRAWRDMVDNLPATTAAQRTALKTSMRIP